MIKVLRNLLIITVLFLFSIYLGFWVYRQYCLRDFDINNALKESRIIKIRDVLYSLNNTPNYDILLISRDDGKTWQEQNFQGIWSVIPHISSLRLQDPVTDIISIDNTLYMIKKDVYGSWDPTTGFYFYSYSHDEGKSWSYYYKIIPHHNRIYLERAYPSNKQFGHTYGIYDSLTKKDTFFKQDPYEILSYPHH